MNTMTKTILFSFLFLTASVLTLQTLSQHNENILAANETQTSKLEVDEINPEGLENIKTALLNPNNLNAEKINLLLNDLVRTKIVQTHYGQGPLPTLPLSPILAIWSAFALLSMMVVVVKTRNNHEISPLFKQSMDSLEYPVLMVDSALNIVWQNKKSHHLNYNSQRLEQIFDETLDGSEVTLDSKTFSVLVSEFNLKGNQKNYLAHLIPRAKITSVEAARNFESDTSANTI